MASIGYFTTYPHQFRLTHDISLESFKLDDGYEYDHNDWSFMDTSPQSSARNNSVAENYLDRHRDRLSDCRWTAARDYSQHSSGDCRNDPLDDDVFINEDSPKRKQAEEPLLIEQAGPLNNAHKSRPKRHRKPRKLPEIPTSLPKRSISPMSTSASTELSLYEELLQAGWSSRSLEKLETASSDDNNTDSEVMKETEHARLEENGHINHKNMGQSPEKYNLNGTCQSPRRSITKLKKTSEFSGKGDFIDDEPTGLGHRMNDLDKMKLSFDCGSYIGGKDDSSCSSPSYNNKYSHADACWDFIKPPKMSLSEVGKTSSMDSYSGHSPLPRSSVSSTASSDLEDLDATHRGCHKFIPRHPEEIFIEIGDPIYVEVEADDLWCEGVNLRTGKKGIFPAAYAMDLSFLEDDDFDGVRPKKFRMHFLGSVEVSYHKGTEVLTQAIQKVVLSRKKAPNIAPPPYVLLEITEYGIRMTDKSKKNKKETEVSAADSVRTKVMKLLTRAKEKESLKELDNFFSLKNISYCGCHPKNEKYFAFITKHPIEMRFACHVFLSEKSGKPMAEAIGNAFKRFYQEYMAFVHPTEDIYLE